MRTIFALLTVALLSSCASNPYKDFYADNTKGKDLSTLPVIIPSEKPTLIKGFDPMEDSKKMTREGYLMLGYSSFHGAYQDTSDALDFAEKIKAEIVIVYSKQTGTKSGALPMTMPTSQTSYSSGNATLYGSNGNTYNAYGSGTTTTYGTQTNHIPFSIDQYDQGAQFWIKGKPSIFGAYAVELTEEKRKEISSNKGVEIAAVVKGSPAFNADFLEGDIIKKINKSDASTTSDFNNLIESNAGKTVEIEIIRSGKTIKKSVELNQAA